MECRTESKPCGDREFECASGTCVPLDFICDQVTDCDDRSDEDEQRCKVCIPHFLIVFDGLLRKYGEKGFSVGNFYIR